MASRTITTITDDLDNSVDAETIEFSFKGTTWSIDLGQKNQQRMLKALQPYIDAGTKVSGRRSSTPKRSASRNRSGRDLAAVRAWAKESGYAVSGRGRVSQEILDAYDAAPDA